MIRVLIADDHGIVRSGLRMLIERQPDMEVVAEAEDGVSALESTQQHRPTVALLDVSMPRMTGLPAALARGSREKGPGAGLGLRGMAERARLAGGELDVRSAPGGGTTVTLRIAELQRVVS